MDYQTKSAEETQKVAGIIAKNLLNSKNPTQPLVITLTGDLGAGKTTFVQGFAKSLNITDQIISPTFVVMRQHQIPNTEQTLYHIDLYRLENVSATDIGLSDLFEDPNAIILIEWPEKLSNSLPQETIQISLKKVSDQERTIELN